MTDRDRLLEMLDRVHDGDAWHGPSVMSTVRGVAASDAIADAYCGPERSELCRAYLRDNIKYVLDDRAADGLRRYYELAARHGVIETPQPMTFY